MKKLISTIALFAGSLIVPAVTLAQAGAGDIKLYPGQESKFLGMTTNIAFTIPRLITVGISIVLIVAALLFFFMLIMGGIRWIMSGGEKGNVENARKQITNALIGLAIIFVAWAIVRLMGSIFGVDLLEMTIPKI